MGFLCHTYSLDSWLFGLRSPCCCLCTGCNGSHLLCPEELPTNSRAQAHRKLLPGPEARQEASLHFPVKTQNDQSAHWRLTETAPPGSNHPVSLLGDSVSICLCQPRNTDCGPAPPSCGTSCPALTVILLVWARQLLLAILLWTGKRSWRLMGVMRAKKKGCRVLADVIVMCVGVWVCVCVRVCVHDLPQSRCSDVFDCDRSLSSSLL